MSADMIPTEALRPTSGQRIVDRAVEDLERLGIEGAEEARANRVDAYAVELGRVTDARLTIEIALLERAHLLAMKCSPILRQFCEDEIQWMLDAVLEEQEGRGHDRRDPSSGIAR